MRKLLLLLALGIFALQLPAHAFLRIGLKAGVNFANVSTDQDSVNFERTPGFIIGPSAEIALAPALSIRTELLYTQKGAKFTAAGQDGKLKLDEIVLAPFLVARFPLPNIMPFLQIGPEFSLNTLAKQETGGRESTIGSIWRNNNFSMNVGGGVILPVGANDLTFDVRYNLGLVNLLTGAGEKDTKTNGVQLFLGYNFLKI